MDKVFSEFTRGTNFAVGIRKDEGNEEYNDLAYKAIALSGAHQLVSVARRSSLEIRASRMVAPVSWTTKGLANNRTYRIKTTA